MADAINIPWFTYCATTGKYEARRKLTAKQIINASRRLLATQVRSGALITGRGTLINYLCTHYSDRKNEIFICLFLNNKSRLIKEEHLFQGTINAATVYPRIVVQKCMEYNAAGVIFAHNHPSGNKSPSWADKAITEKLVDVLRAVDVRVIDHIVIGSDGGFSFIEHGLIDNGGSGMVTR